ncbi:MAG: hypothetical protein K6T66_08305 [Peptococcaceae bacterium]|nr:hypothetical protein [Peptococcaceae bacterium]
MRPLLCNLLFCNKIESGEGKFNLEGIFYRVHAAGYPCRHRCCVVVGWCGDGGNHSFGLRFLPPDRGRPLFEIPSYPFRLTPEAPYFNGVIEVDLPLDREGTYWFEVSLNGQLQGFFPLHVKTASRTGLLSQNPPTLHQ